MIEAFGDVPVLGVGLVLGVFQMFKALGVFQVFQTFQKRVGSGNGQISAFKRRLAGTPSGSDRVVFQSEIRNPESKIQILKLLLTPRTCNSSRL